MIIKDQPFSPSYVFAPPPPPIPPAPVCKLSLFFSVYSTSVSQVEHGGGGVGAVLQIHDISVLIRIRIRGSMPLTN
jgi:hypothetical protein